jgi:hypothetical protein
VYETDTDKTQVWNGSAWVLLSTGTANPPGLELIKTQTIGSAVSEVEVLDAFSADYDAYRVIVSGGVMSAIMNIQLQLGPTSISNHNNSYYYRNIGLTYAGATNNIQGANTSTIQYAGVGTTDDISFNVEIINPFLSKFTHFSSTRIFSSATGDAQNMAAVHRRATSYTAFKLLPLTSATFTGGTIRVYGYRN